ncbi:MAG: YncE family protein [Ferruginibacter sp.]
MKKQLLRWAIPVTVLFSACKKDDTTKKPDPVAPAKGVYVLSEGSFGGNNAKLAFRPTTGTVSGDFFVQQNPLMTAGLGDLANDAVIYGGKLYIVMNGSGNVTVVNAASGAYINKISFLDGATNKSPRYAIGYRGKLYVTAYDATVSVIDTATLAITKSIPVGPNPEGIVAVGDYLYVANSGGFNLVPDSTVSVISLATNAETKKIVVGVNPQRIAANSAGDLYVSAYGNFTTIPASVSVVSSSSQTLKTILGAGFAYDHLTIYNDIAYLYNNYGGSGTCKLLNTITNTVVREEFITDGTVVTVPYGINVDEENGDVYIGDAKNFATAGEVTCFASNGAKKFSFSVAPGINPNKIVFLR